MLGVHKAGFRREGHICSIEGVAVLTVYVVDKFIIVTLVYTIKVFAPFSGSRRPPSCYVSYQSAEQESPLCTEVVMNDDSPTWSYNLQTRLHKELLTDDLKVPSSSLLGSGHQLRGGGYKTGGGGGGK